MDKIRKSKLTWSIWFLFWGVASFISAALVEGADACWVFGALAIVMAIIVAFYDKRRPWKWL